MIVVAYLKTLPQEQDKSAMEATLRSAKPGDAVFIKIKDTCPCSKDKYYYYKFEVQENQDGKIRFKGNEQRSAPDIIERYAASDIVILKEGDHVKVKYNKENETDPDGSNKVVDGTITKIIRYKPSGKDAKTVNSFSSVMISPATSFDQAGQTFSQKDYEKMRDIWQRYTQDPKAFAAELGVKPNFNVTVAKFVSTTGVSCELQCYQN